MPRSDGSRAGATQAQAQAELENVMRELARLYPVSNGEHDRPR